MAGFADRQGIADLRGWLSQYTLTYGEWVTLKTDKRDGETLPDEGGRSQEARRVRAP